MTNVSLALATTRTSPADERKRLLESFQIALDAAGLSPATTRLYTHGVRQLYAFLGRIGLDAPLAAISADHLREGPRSATPAGAGPETT